MGKTLREELEEIVYDLPLVPNGEPFPKGSSYFPPSAVARYVLEALITRREREAVERFAENVNKRIIMRPMPNVPMNIEIASQYIYQELAALQNNGKGENVQ